MLTDFLSSSGKDDFGGSVEVSGFVGYNLFRSGKIGDAVFNDFILDANSAIS